MTFHQLKEYCLAYSPEVIFLIEIKNREPFVKKKLSRCGFDNFLTIEPTGKARGSAIA